MKSPISNGGKGSGCNRSFLLSLLAFTLVTFFSLYAITPVFATATNPPSFFIEGERDGLT